MERTFITRLNWFWYVWNCFLLLTIITIDIRLCLKRRKYIILACVVVYTRDMWQYLNYTHAWQYTLKDMPALFLHCNNSTLLTLHARIVVVYTRKMYDSSTMHAFVILFLTKICDNMHKKYACTTGSMPDTDFPRNSMRLLTWCLFEFKQNRVHKGLNTTIIYFMPTYKCRVGGGSPHI